MIAVDEELCSGCAICVPECPHGAIHMERGLAVIDPDLCVQCGDCMDVCPREAVREVSPITATGISPGSAVVGHEEGREGWQMANELKQDFEIIETEARSEKKSSDRLRGLAVLGGTLLGSFVDTLLERRQAGRFEAVVDGQTRIIEEDDPGQPSIGRWGRGMQKGRRSGRGRGPGQGQGRGRRRRNFS